MDHSETRLENEIAHRGPAEVDHLISKDVYWGEFSIDHLHTLTSLLRSEGLLAAREYAKKIKRDDFIFGIERSNFIHYLELNEDSTVLDCGAGLGTHTFNLSPLVKEVHAFDQSSDRIEFCAERARFEGKDNIHLYHSDFEHLEFPDNFFDAIIMNGVVEWLGEIEKHADPREDQLEILRFLRKKLKPGGILYVGIENRIALAYLRGRDHSGIKFTNYYPRWLADIVTKYKKGKHYRTYTYTKKGYDLLFEDAGFRNDDLTYYIGYPGYNLPRHIIPLYDDQAIRFFLGTLSDKKGVQGMITRSLAGSSLGMWFIRQTVFSYLIFAKKYDRES